MGDDIATLLKLVKDMSVKQEAMAQQIAVLTAERPRSKTPKKKASSNYVPPTWATTQGLYLASADMMKEKGKLLVKHIIPSYNDDYHEVFAVWNGSVFTADYDDGSTIVYENLRDFAVGHKERASCRFKGTKGNIKDTDGWEEVKYEWMPNKWRAVSNLRPAGAAPDLKPRSVSRSKTPSRSPTAATSNAGSAPASAPKSAPKSTPKLAPAPAPEPDEDDDDEDDEEHEFLSEVWEGQLVDLGDGEGFAYDIKLKTGEVKLDINNKIVGKLNAGRFVHYKLVKEDGDFVVKNIMTGDLAPMGEPK